MASTETRLPRFMDEDLDAINCESTWRRHDNAQSTSASCQTLELETHDVGIMSVESFETGCQTAGFHQNAAFDDRLTDEFLDALQIAAVRMMEELSRSRTKAFENYHVTWDDEDESVSCLLSMNEPSTDKYVDMPVTALSWNSTGSVVAASYGHIDHNDWCNHKAKLCVWNINRHDKSAGAPDNSIDVESCVMCVTFHESSPGLLAAGTFAGHVLIWDQARDPDTSVLVSDPQQDTQGDSICQVSWLVDKRKNSVVSISNSGRVTIWAVAQKGAALSVLKSLRIEAPPTFKLGVKSDCVGASVVSVDPADRRSFLVGTESGGVVRCSLDSEAVKAVFSFRSHHGPVYGLQFSSLIRNTFITCATDGCVNIFSTLQEAPLVTLEPCQGYLYSSTFSPTNSAILAVGGSRGKVVFYNLNYTHLAPFYVLDCCEKRTPVRCVQFNHRHTSLLATGDGRGQVKVWSLGADLTSDDQNTIPAVIRDAMVRDG